MSIHTISSVKVKLGIFACSVKNSSVDLNIFIEGKEKPAPWTLSLLLLRGNSKGHTGSLKHADCFKE